jgi:lipopolysaccharide/colanic/teichoic acid biosynthesis glycosyltransferase
MLRSAGALTAAFATVLALVFFLKESEDFSRIVIGTVFVLSLAFIISGRAVLGAVARRRLGDNPFDQLVITDGAYFPDAGSSARVLDAQRAGLTPSLQDPNMLNRLGRAVAGYDRVLVACPAERRALWSMLLKGANVDGEVLSAECEDIGAIGIGRWGDRVTLRVACGPLHMQERLLKRALDLSIAVPLLVLLAPLLLVIAIAIKMDSPGPIFFRQTRMGRGNTTSQLDHAGNRSTGRNDDRITRVGRFIRRTSIDELPQLLNVLKGDMSLVGPRPHALGSLAGEKLFWEVDQRYWLRHACKPGMTGLAQVRGFRGATEQTHDLTNRLKADLEYLDDWTIWRDIGILLRTLQVVVHPQAY